MSELFLLENFRLHDLCDHSYQHRERAKVIIKKQSSSLDHLWGLTIVLTFQKSFCGKSALYLLLLCNLQLNRISFSKTFAFFCNQSNVQLNIKRLRRKNKLLYISIWHTLGSGQRIIFRTLGLDEKTRQRSNYCLLKQNVVSQRYFYSSSLTGIITIFSVTEKSPYKTKY